MTIYIRMPEDSITKALREARKAVAWGREERVEIVVSATSRLRTVKRVVYFREGRFIRKEVR